MQVLLFARSTVTDLTEEVFERLEVWPVERVVRPALQHELVDVGGAVLGLRQALAFLVQLLQDLTPQQHTKYMYGTRHVELATCVRVRGMRYLLHVQCTCHVVLVNISAHISISILSQD